MVDIPSATAEIGRGKKKERTNDRMKIYRAAINNVKKVKGMQSTRINQEKTVPHPLLMH